MVVLDSSDDDGAAMPLPLTTETPPSANRAGVEMRGARRAREATAVVLETARTTPAAAAGAASQVPELLPGSSSRGHRLEEC